MPIYEYKCTKCGKEFEVLQRSFDVDEQDKGLFSRFKRSGNKLIALKARYAKAETNVDQICDALEAHAAKTRRRREVHGLGKGDVGDARIGL